MVQTVNVMIGKIQGRTVSEDCAVRHLYNCNDLEQATQGQGASIHTGRFIKRSHNVTSSHPHIDIHTLFFSAAHKICLSPVELTHNQHK